MPRRWNDIHPLALHQVVFVQTDPDMLEARSITGNQFGIFLGEGIVGTVRVMAVRRHHQQRVRYPLHFLVRHVDDREADRAHVAVAVGGEISA